MAFQSLMIRPLRPLLRESHGPHWLHVMNTEYGVKRDRQALLLPCFSEHYLIMHRDAQNLTGMIAVYFNLPVIACLEIYSCGFRISGISDLESIPWIASFDSRSGQL